MFKLESSLGYKYTTRDYWELTGIASDSLDDTRYPVVHLAQNEETPFVVLFDVAPEALESDLELIFYEDNWESDPAQIIIFKLLNF